MSRRLGDFRQGRTARKSTVARSRGAALTLVALLSLGRLRGAEAGPNGLILLRGNTRPEAVATNDLGPVSDGLSFPHLLLQLQRTPEQEQALEQFLADLHDPTSPLFHQWLTAAEFGQRFGVAPPDLAKVSAWLESQGFQVNLVYPNQMVIDFRAQRGTSFEASTPRFTICW